MRRIAALAVSLVVLAATSSRAAYHLAQIDEVMSGVGADPSAQYFEVRMLISGQGLTKDVRITAWNCAGTTPMVLAQLPSDLAMCSHVAGVKWSAGTASWAALHPGTPLDFSMLAGIPPTCGTVCWGAPPDMTGRPAAVFDTTNPNCYTGCLTYGSGAVVPTGGACAGGTVYETSGSPAGNGTMSLQRTMPGGTTFALAAPTPENATCSTTTTTSTTTSTTTPPLSKCTSLKFKASGKKANDKAVCHAKAVSKGLSMIDSTCLAKTEVKFSTSVAKAEAKAPAECLTTGDASTLEGDVDGFIGQLSTDLGGPGPSKCSSSKYKASGKKAASKLGCHAKALSKGIPVDSTCLAKTEVKFSTTVAKTEAKAPAECLTTGDASTVETHVDTFVDDIHGALVP